MLRKILLLLCIAITVVCYGWPCLVVPFGKYEGKVGETAVSYEFGFNGTVVCKYGDETIIGKYELDFKNKGIKVTLDGHETESIELNNMYSFDNLVTFKNQIGEYAMLGIGILAVVIVLISPNGNGD